MLNYFYDSKGFVSSGRADDVADIFEPDSIMGTLFNVNEKGIKALEAAFEKLSKGDSFTATLDNGDTIKIEKPL